MNDYIEYVKENDVSGFKFIKCGKFNIDEKRESEKDDEKSRHRQQKTICLAGAGWTYKNAVPHCHSPFEGSGKTRTVRITT